MLKTFDEIYILNLHGNVKTKETAPNKSNDKNVFNIMVGNCIVIFVKNKEKRANFTYKNFQTDEEFDKTRVFIKMFGAQKAKNMNFKGI